MTIKEKIQHADAFSVNLYKEGVFWTAYEQSAYAVHEIRRNYKVSKKYVKAAAAEVVSVGFPDSAMQNMLQEFEVLEKDDRQVRLRTRKPVSLPCKRESEPQGKPIVVRV